MIRHRQHSGQIARSARVVLAACLLLAPIAATVPTPAFAAVPTSASSVTLPGNGSQTAFSFAFVGVAAADISVIFTDASGNQTTLAQGPGPTQYQVSLNAAVPPALWGVGGTVTYNPSGTPIASGTTLTISRTLPLTQQTSLQNQASFGQYASAAEQAIDQAVMALQQVASNNSRAIVGNIANSSPPLPLPPAAQLANKGICADSTGLNLVGCVLPSSGVISNAMQPVVNAASLAAGRAAFGLGSMATEAINAGNCGGPSVQDDGAGNARVVPATAADAVNQTVTCNFHLTQRMATGPINYSLGAAQAIYFNGFTFTINALAGIITVVPNAADNFVGVASGTAIAIPQGSICRITTNAAANATWWLDCNNSQASLAANVSGNALTITLNASMLPFRNTNLPSGDGKWALPAGGIGITIPSGATLGVANNAVAGVTQTPFRIWIFIAYNSGTPVLGVATCSNATSSAVNLYPCAAWETAQKSGAAISAAATAPGILYTAGTVTNDAVRIVGYAEYGSGLVTPGTWSVNPTTLQLCMPPFICPRPGTVIQSSLVFIGTNSTTASGTFSNSVVTAPITPTAASNLIDVYAQGHLTNSIDTDGALIRLVRGATPIGVGNFQTIAPANSGGASIPISWSDFPASLSAVVYTVQLAASVGGTAGYPNNNGFITLKEIMGALPDPVNDSGSTELRMAG